MKMPHAPLLILVILFVSDGLLLVAVSVPLIRRRVKPNLVYGFRVAKTLSDPGVWYAANEYAGRMLLRAGAFIAPFCLALAFVPGITLLGYAIAGGLVSVGSVLVAAWRSFRYLNSL